MKVLTFFNHAGGAGKSTLTRDIGYTLSQQGLRVLLIELDPQGNLSSWLGVFDVSGAQTVAETAVNNAPLPQPLQVFGMHLIPSNLDLAMAENRMTGSIGSQLNLRERVREWSERYDLVLIDSPPSLGNLTVMGAVAADHLIVPVPTRDKGLRGLKGVTSAVTSYRRLNPGLNVALFVPTLYDARTRHDQDNLQTMRTMLHPLASPLRYRAATWNDSCTAGQPLGLYAPNSEAYSDVLQLAREVLDAIGMEVPHA
ncbi:ParA family protein [Deinococcus sonorensis]|uniref:ParA family protein n=2 Tax=Deinococcus sonorensis TaxID=309891 RepID=A0AAU7U4V5_9DEIO